LTASLQDHSEQMINHNHQRKHCSE